MTIDRVKEAAINCSFRASLIKSKKIKKTDPLERKNLDQEHCKKRNLTTRTTTNRNSGKLIIYIKKNLQLHSFLPTTPHPPS